MSFPDDPSTLPDNSDAHAAEPPTEPPAEPPGRARQSRTILASVMVALVAGIAGAAIVHAAWSGGSSTPRASASTPAARGTSPSSATSPSRPSASVGTSAASSSASAIAARVDGGLVDINTTLGTEGAAAGTGMVITSDGEVITNNHVIAGATSITATDIGNGKTYRARVVGYDTAKDVAVIQLIGASGLSTVTLGDSSTAHVGQSVVTIGNAGGLGGTPSAASGSVVALGQSITATDGSGGTSEHLSGLIQLDGSLEPGDSGGPLVNSAGAVIGMDTAASSSFNFQTSGSEGFAIPINRVVSLARKITAGETSDTIHIGATALIGVDVSSQPQIGFGQATSPRGAYVLAVVAGTPAANAGIAAGDTITGLDGRTIKSAAGLSAAKTRLHPGDTVSVTWIDGSGASHTAMLTLTSGPPV